MSKERNFSNKISELSDIDAVSHVINDDFTSSDQDFINALSNSMNHSALRPNQNYTIRSKAYLMHKYGEAQSKRNALISFVNVKEHFIDLSKILVRSAVVAPVAAAVIFAFIGGYVFGNTSLSNEDVQTAQVINVQNNLNDTIASPENINVISNLPGIVMTTDIVQPAISPNDNDVNEVIDTQSRVLSNEKNSQSSISNNVVDSEMQSQLDSLQLSLTAIADLAERDQPLDSSLLHSISGNLHAITSYIQNTDKISPTFVMQFLETSTGVRSSIATAGNADNDLAYVAADIATQEGIIGAARYFDANPNAFLIYAANNW